MTQYVLRTPSENPKVVNLINSGDEVLSELGRKQNGEIRRHSVGCDFHFIFVLDLGII